METKALREALNFVRTIQFWRMAILWTISLVISYLHLLSQTLLSATKPDSRPRISRSLVSKHGSSPIPRPVCIITGATSGLGAAAAYYLSMEGFLAVLLGRSSYRLSKVEEEIRRRNKDAQLKCFMVDVSSFESILNFRSSFHQWLSDADLHSSVQLLVNNAGILATSFRYSAEGYDQMMATNYFGAFCLTKVLLPLLENSPVPSRVINITSFTHRSASHVQVDKETLHGEHFSKFKIYPCAQIYEYSKLYLLLFTYELHQQFGLAGKSHHVSVVAVDPGAVNTNIMREVPTYLSSLALFGLKLLGLLHSPETGVLSIVDAALAPPELSGVYFFGGNGRTINSSATSYNAKLARELWNASCDLFLEAHKAWSDTSS